MNGQITFKSIARRLSLGGLTLSLILCACEKDKSSPNPQPQPDPSKPSVNPEGSSQSLNLLTAPNNGWEAAVYPTANKRFGGYTLYIRFDKEGKVRIASELLADDAVSEGKFELKTTEGQESLSFTDNNDAIRLKTSEGEDAQLASHSDDSYTISSISDKEVKLSGKVNGTTITLRPAATTTWAEQIAKVKSSRMNNPVKRFSLQAGDQELATGTVESNRHLKLKPKNGQLTGYPFRYTSEGIELAELVTFAEHKMQRFTHSASSEAPALQCQESSIALKALSDPLATLFLKNAYTIEAENLTGRSKRVYDFLVKRMQKVDITFKTLKLGTLDKKQALFIEAIQKPAFPLPGEPKEKAISIALPFMIEAPSNDVITFNFNAGAIQEGGGPSGQDTPLYTYTFGGRYRLDLLAYGFASIKGEEYTDPKTKEKKMRFDDGKYAARSFKITADRPSNPTRITLTDQTESNPTTPNTITFKLVTE